MLPLAQKSVAGTTKFFWPNDVGRWSDGLRQRLVVCGLGHLDVLDPLPQPRVLQHLCQAGPGTRFPSKAGQDQLLALRRDGSPPLNVCAEYFFVPLEWNVALEHV